MNIFMYAVVNIVLSALVLLGIYYIWYRQNNKSKYNKITCVPDHNKFVPSGSRVSMIKASPDHLIPCTCYDGKDKSEYVIVCVDGKEK